jgi:hypothetical protein
VVVRALLYVDIEKKYTITRDEFQGRLSNDIRLADGAFVNLEGRSLGSRLPISGASFKESDLGDHQDFNT